MEFDNGRNKRPRSIRSVTRNQRSRSDRREARGLGRRQSLAVLEAGCCPPPFGIEHSRSCLKFPIETLTLAATVGAKVEVPLLEAMRFTAMRTVQNIRIRRDRLERLQLVPFHIESNIHRFPCRRAVHEHL